MKTAISLPDNLFKQAESAARKLKVSRSQLYANAIKEFLDRRKDDEVTRKLNEVYSKEPSEIDPAMHEAQLRVIAKDPW